MKPIHSRATIALAALAAALFASAAAAAQDGSTHSRDSAGGEARPPAAGRGRGEAPARAVRGSRTRVGRDVIDARAGSERDVHALLTAVRPLWLATRGTGEGVKVFCNDVHCGDAGVLRLIPLAAVERVEWLSGIEATTRFGTGYGAGAILVYMRR